MARLIRFTFFLFDIPWLSPHVVRHLRWSRNSFNEIALNITDCDDKINQFLFNILNVQKKTQAVFDQQLLRLQDCEKSNHF